MLELKQIDKTNISVYKEYEKAFDDDLKNYQSRIYPSENAECLRWYHIKSDNKYIGAIWLEKNANEAFAVLGIFIAGKDYRDKGIGKAAIQQILNNDLSSMHTSKVILRVREENKRAVTCYKGVGFKEVRRYKKDKINVIEMEYSADLVW